MHRRPPTTNEFLLLALLAEGPKSGYDLDTVVAERRLRSWTPLGMSSLYFLLDGMRRRGWIATKSEQGKRGPARRVCRLTPAGSAVLHERVSTAFAVAPAPSADVDIACMNLLGTGSPAFAALIAVYERILVENLGQVRAASRRVAPGPYGLAPKLIFARHIAALKAELSWARGAMKSLRRRSP
jgi:DNA-binding PadR family transcriptional regulator